MKNLFILIILTFFLNACASNQSIVSSGKIKVNMTKSELQDALVFSYPGDDPFIPGGGSTYVMENTAEIIWGENANTYYVFGYVSETVSCGVLLCKLGNGALLSWHDTFDQARASLPKVELTQTQKINQMPSTSTTETSSTSSSSSGSYNETKYLICYGEMTKAHKKRGFHDRNREASIKVKETVCKAYAKGDINDYEGKGL